MLVGLVLLIGPGACGESGPVDTSHTTRTDSAGVEIVVSSAPAWGQDEAWHLAEEATLDLPSIDPDGRRHFFDVKSGHRYPDGRILVGDLLAKQLRFYRPDGSFIRAGSQPAGPGTFATVAGFVVGPSDSLAVYDMHSNATILGPEGEYVRRLPLPDQHVLRSELLAWLPGGLFCAVGSYRHGTEPEAPSFPPSASREEAVPFCFEEESPVTGDTVPTKFGAYPQPLLHDFTFGDNAWAALPTPFTTRASIAMLPGTILIAPGEKAEIQFRRVSSPDAGHLERIVRLDRPRVPATDSLREKMIDRIREADAPWEEYRLAYIEAIRVTQLPDSVSAIEKLVVDQEGNIWLGHPWPEAGEWSVLRSDGAWLGAVMIPDGMTPLEIGKDWILVRTPGGTKEPFSVRLYDLVKPR